MVKIKNRSCFPSESLHIIDMVISNSNHEKPLIYDKNDKTHAH